MIFAAGVAVKVEAIEPSLVRLCAPSCTGGGRAKVGVQSRLWLRLIHDPWLLKVSLSDSNPHPGAIAMPGQVLDRHDP